ncbi:MAG: hypothetical protein ACN0LA_00780 [Candidatus Longimicrobiales bacterium M2_2A_002]
MTRAATILLAALLLSGCSNMGLDAGPIPLEEARHAPPPELVAAVHARPADADATLVMDGRLWVTWGLPATYERATLRPVGSTHGVTVYAYSWDRPPLDELFVPAGEKWQGYAVVIGRSGPAATADAGASDPADR